MKQIYPDFYPEFRCLAGDCPDTCCKDWEVVVDPEAMEFYQSVPGALGERLKNGFVEQDGDICFRLENGKCTFLTEDGLCELQKTFGEKGLCRICASHPRFLEEYGATQEITLSISCPEAARLLLCRQEPICFLTQETDEAVDTPNALDPELYFTLRSVRETVLRLVQDRSRPIRDRLSLALLLCQKVQKRIDMRSLAAVSKLCTQFSARSEQERLLLRLRRCRRRSADFFPAWLLLRNMEHLTAEFPALLERCAHERRPENAFFERFSVQLENLAVYFFFRYLLKASVDGALMEKAGACVFHVLAISRLAASMQIEALPELCHLCGLYSKEVEHSEENLQLLYRTIRHGALRVGTLLAMI